MSDAKSEIRRAVEEHGHSLEELHRKIAAMPAVDKEKLSHAVAKLKAAHAAFSDDAQACIGF